MKNNCENCFHFFPFSEEKIKQCKKIIEEEEKIANHKNWFVRVFGKFFSTTDFYTFGIAKINLDVYEHCGLCTLNPKWIEVHKEHWCSHIILKEK